MNRTVIALPLACAALLLSASSASAATIVLDRCTAAAVCNEVRVSTVLRDSDWIRVEVSDVAGGESIGLFGDGATNRAFAFNVAGSPAGVTITGLAPGFTLDQSGINTGPFGTFEFVINGAASADDARLPLYFNVTRAGGFTSDRDLFDANAAGFLFHAHVRNEIRDVAGFAGAGAGQIHSLPEPASMVLLGTGLGALAFRRLRRAA